MSDSNSKYIIIFQNGGLEKAMGAGYRWIWVRQTCKRKTSEHSHDYTHNNSGLVALEAGTFTYQLETGACKYGYKDQP